MTTWGPSFLHAPLLHWWIPLVVVPLVLVGLGSLARLTPRQRGLYGLLLAGVVAGFGTVYLARAANNVAAPPDWDVKVFWLWGRVAASGENFYRPAAMHQAAQAQALEPDDPRFRDFVLDVGFHYPPPAALLVAPFGLFDLHTGALLWYLAQLSALACVLLLLWRTFLAEHGWLGLLAMAALLLCLRSAYTTIGFGQTNFIALALFLPFWKRPSSVGGGAALGLAIAVKPFLALVLPALALCRQWRALATALACLAGLTVATLFLFGTGPFLAYLAENPVSRLPPTLYIFEENQSLLAAIMRWTGDDPTARSPLLHPYYLLASSLVTAVTAAAVWASARRDPGLALAVTLAAVLLVYPQSWAHYTVFLIVPMTALWARRDGIGIGTSAAVALLSTVYALNRYDRGAIAMWGTLLLWVALGAACGVIARRVPRATRRAAERLEPSAMAGARVPLG